MTIDRDLLWRAYPAGFLIGDGVGTVGGWRCVEVAPFGSTWAGRQVDGYRFAILGGDVQKDSDGLYEQRSDWRLGMDTFRAAIDMGDLLPNLDPKDVATWECAKRDLAKVVWTDMAARQPAPISCVRWKRWPENKGIPAHWGLMVFTVDGGSYGGSVRGRCQVSYDLDPAIALATARAQFRRQR